MHATSDLLDYSFIDFWELQICTRYEVKCLLLLSCGNNTIQKL